MAKQPIIIPSVSWDALTETAKARPGITPPAGAYSFSIERGDNAWAGGSFESALNRMAHGWPEGVRAIEDLTFVTPTGADTVQWELDVAGYFPLVPAYLSGDPACMMVQELGDGQKSKIALCVPTSYSARVKPSTAMACAAALAQVVAELDASGVDCALYGTDSTIGTGHRVVTTYRVREFGEPLDLSKVAFMLHPAFLRRILFAHYESHKVYVDNGLASENYGRPAPISAAEVCQSLGWDPAPIIVPRLGENSPLNNACERGDVGAAVDALRALIQVQLSGEVPAQAA